MRSSTEPLKLFVGDIGSNRKSDLSRIFSKYGEISTIYVDDNKHFAFVEFTSTNDAQHALQRTNNKTVNGAKLRVEYAKPDKPFRDNRRPLSREHTPVSTFYNHLQVTANRLPPMQSIRSNYYQHHSSTMMPNSAISRGRSLTPPSFKQNARVSSMNHLRSPDFYSPYYPPHPVVYTDPAYYRAYGDPYLMQRLPPPPPAAFFPPTSSSSSSSSSSRAHRNMYPSSGLDRYPTVTSHRRLQRSRSRSRRRNSLSRRDRSSREKKRKRRTSPSLPSPKHQRERGPQTPPTSSSHRTKQRSRSNSDTVASTSEQKSSASSPSSTEDENNEDKQSNSKRSQDNHSSNRKHSKRKTRE